MKEDIYDIKSYKINKAEKLHIEEGNKNEDL